ncbi:hypothetical protein RBB50_003603 [Rhinocladiella similis]
MVTTRLQERLGLDTPNSSSVEETSNATVSPSVSRATRKRTASKIETPKSAAKTRAAKISVETDQTPQPPQSQIDTPPTTNKQDLPERLKSPVEFYTPAVAKTPANKRRRFESDEPEDSILDTFQTPAEYPRTRDAATEDDDSDAAPEVVSTRSSARRARNTPGSSSKGSSSKRRKTATPTSPYKASNLAPGSDTIDVARPNSTSDGAVAQTSENAVVRGQSTTEQAPETDFTATTAEDKDQNDPVANAVDNPTLTDSDTTITAQPNSADKPSASLPGGADQSAVTQVEDRGTIVVEPTVDIETLNDQESKGANGDTAPSSSSARTGQDKASSNVQSETLSPSPTPPLPVPAVTNPTITTAAAAVAAAGPKQSIPLSYIRSTAHPRSHTTSAHPSTVVKKAKTAKTSTIFTRRQPASALLREHLPNPNPKPSSLQDFRSRMFNRHARSANFGAPGQKRVKFVGA